MINCIIMIIQKHGKNSYNMFIDEFQVQNMSYNNHDTKSWVSKRWKETIQYAVVTLRLKGSWVTFSSTFPAFHNVYVLSIIQWFRAQMLQLHACIQTWLHLLPGWIWTSSEVSINSEMSINLATLSEVVKI